MYHRVLKITRLQTMNLAKIHQVAAVNVVVVAPTSLAIAITGHIKMSPIFGMK